MVEEQPTIGGEQGHCLEAANITKSFKQSTITNLQILSTEVILNVTRTNVSALL